MTHQEIVKKHSKFKPGDLITITKQAREEDGKGRCLLKIKGKVLGVYPNFILVGEGKDYATKECFTYTDIAATGCIEKSRRTA